MAGSCRGYQVTTLSACFFVSLRNRDLCRVSGMEGGTPLFPISLADTCRVESAMTA